ncbi:MAG: sugar porter family MFS transporter [Rhodothermales bacterium]
MSTTSPRRGALSLIAFIAALGGFLFGFDTAVISGTLGLVPAQFGLSTVQEGWFVSSGLVGCIIGVLFAGWLSDRYGRKHTLLLSGVLFLVSAIGCMLAETFSLLVTMRLIGGVGVGVASMLSPIYLAEMAPAKLRGRMVTLYQLAITIGILCAYLSNAALLGMADGWTGAEGWLGWVLGDEAWRGMFGAEAIPALLFLALTVFIPESGRWLLQQGRTEEARAVFERFQPAAEVSQHIATVQASFDQPQSTLADLLKPGLRTALWLGLLIAFMAQFSGINAVIYYGPRIFAEAGFTLGDALGGQVTVGIVNVLFTFVAIAVIDRWGRRPLLLTGALGTGGLLLALGLLFALGLEQSPLLLIGILAFIAFFALSLGPVHWTILAEIYPTRIRGRAMSIATLGVWTATAIVGQIFPWLLETLGPAGAFWFFAITSGSMFAVIWRLLPETKNRTLEEIEVLWREKASA